MCYNLIFNFKHKTIAQLGQYKKLYIQQRMLYEFQQEKNIAKAYL